MVKINLNKDDAIISWLRKFGNSQENIYDGVYVSKVLSLQCTDLNSAINIPPQIIFQICSEN